MKLGDRVMVEAAKGARLERRVVAEENGRVFVCTEEELRAAEHEQREPTAVGFRPDKVHAVIG